MRRWVWRGALVSGFVGVVTLGVAGPVLATSEPPSSEPTDTVPVVIVVSDAADTLDAATPSSVAAPDGVTDDSVTDDSVTDDSVTDDSVTDDSVTDDSAAAEADTSSVASEPEDVTVDSLPDVAPTTRMAVAHVHSLLPGEPSDPDLLVVEPEDMAPALMAVAAVGNEVLVLRFDGCFATDGASAELAAAAELGLNVTQVTETEWAAMTTPEFAAYAAIIIPDCDAEFDTPPFAPVVNNSPVWSAAVNGNVVIIGTDPVEHAFGSSSPQYALIKEGIQFAAAEPGKTGLYFSLSDYYGSELSPGAPVPALSGLGDFGIAEADGCYEDAHIVATHEALVGLDDTELSNWGCSVHAVFSSWPAEFVVLAIAEDGPATYTASDGTSGSPYLLASGAALSSTNIALGPATGASAVGTQQCATAQVASGGVPTAGVTVSFAITAGPHAGTSVPGGLTDASGRVAGCYQGQAAGDDTLVASFVDTRGVTQSSNTVTRTWTGTTSSTSTSTSTTVVTTTVGGSSTTIVAGNQPTTTAPAGSLPATGSDLSWLVMVIGVGFVLAGLGAVAATRYRSC